jgi:raffinose synthase
MIEYQQPNKRRTTMDDIQALATLIDGTLAVGGSMVLAGVSAQVTLQADPLETGVFVTTSADAFAARFVIPLGKPATLARFTCTHRFEPYWMEPSAGTRASEIPVETQFLLAQLTDGRYALFLPILDGAFRAALEGDADDHLLLVVESGDPAVVCREATALFIAVGENPYLLMELSAASVMARMGTGRLRRDKPLPAFVELFGWCTWDAFYQEVTQDNVRQGLESFAAGGLLPRFMILDDGWQSEQTLPSGERCLTAFAPNAKFAHDLSPTVAMAKEEFGLDYFYVWHALQGYWGGVDPASFPRYRITPTPPVFSPGIIAYGERANMPFCGRAVRLVAAQSIHRFFNDYHRALALQGVDGVKVDSQSMLEVVAYGQGGRVELMRRYHEALEGSVQTHFLGQLINCMSCSNEVLFSALNSTVTRSSTDFWPNLPASHGLHLYTNAQTSFWMGEFVHPDWDMFQSGHAAGAFHAAARAISGGPVYVSDKPESHDFAVLRKLVLSDGSIPRADGIGRPTRDCLLHDVTKEPVLLKIFNSNGDAGVVGVFHAGYHAAEAERTILTGTVSPRDVEGIRGEAFAVYAHYAQTLTVCTRDAHLPVSVPELSCEIFTIVPITEGLAPIGLTDKFNSGGTIVGKRPEVDGTFTLSLRDGGELLLWSGSEPQAVEVNGVSVPFSYTADTGALHVTVDVKGACVVGIR